MKIRELLFELRDSPNEYAVNRDDDVIEALCPELGLQLYLTRGLSHALDSNTVFIEFAVHNKYNLTGTGNAIKIFSTVSAMVNALLLDFLQPGDMFVEFAAERAEPSRVKLYKRIAPVISGILGSMWVRADRPGTGSLYVFSWHRKHLALKEKQVESAWITDLVYNRPNKVLTMRLSTGASYSIPNITRAMFEKWLRAPSKGRFFHQNIKYKFRVSRI